MIWLDAHLPPALATWLTAEMGQPAAHLRALGLRHAKDREIFAAARALGLIGGGEPLVEISDSS